MEPAPTMPPTTPTPAGRIDVHSHLLPQVDDGCRTLEESIAGGREMVAAGYTHSFCTPHVWPSLPHNNAAEITRRVGRLQQAFDDAGVGLKLIPGGELNLRADTPGTNPGDVVT